jgi:ribulose-phosphate 3-epimerase
MSEQPRIKIAPSILAADFWQLGEQIRAAQEAGADRFHIDVMDGHFVPNLSLGLPIVEAMRRGTALPLEAHLMISQPDRYVDQMIEAGIDRVIVHQEAASHLDRLVQHVRTLGSKIGVGLNPATPASTLVEILGELDLVLVMTVNPGFGGQKFIERMLPKIELIRTMLGERNPACELEVDGGIDCLTGPRAAQAGADVLVAGTAIFGDPEGPAAGLRRLVKAVEQSGRQSGGNCR